MPPRVSVIMPLYNYGDFVPAAIESVKAQTFEDWELIVVDDGSTDNGPEVVERIISEDDSGRIWIHRQPQNLKLSAARNAGLSLATGDYISLLDPDDTYDPDKLERQVAIMDEALDLAMVYGCARYRDEVLGDTAFTYGKLRDDCFIPCQSVMMRRSIVNIVGGNDVNFKYAEDWEYWLRLATATNNRIAHMGDSDPVYSVGVHSTVRQQSAHSEHASFCQIAKSRGATFLNAMKDPIKILHLMPEMARGGAQAILYYILKGLSNGSMKHTVATYAMGVVAGEIYGEDLPVDIVRVTKNVSDITAQFNNYDLVHVHDWGDVSVSDIGRDIAKINSERSTIVTEHGDDSVTGAVDSTRIVASYKKYLPDGVACLGNYFPQKINIPNGIPPKPTDALKTRDAVRAQLGANDDQIVITTTSKFARVKGGDLWAGVCECMMRHNPGKYVFVFIGASQGHNSAVASACAGRIAKMRREGHNIKVFGVVAPREVHKLLAASDLFLVNSRSETQCLALLEALDHGLPCVASHVGGIPNVIKEPNKTLHHNERPEVWEAAIVERLKQKDVGSRLPVQNELATMLMHYETLYRTHTMMARIWRDHG